MHEGRLRQDRRLIALGARILDWMWARGWDAEHGGLLYFTDLRGLPVQEYWHDWSFAHFPDAQHGEWFGWLHRDGSLSQCAKGNMFKGPFHLPRMLWYCWRLIEGKNNSTDKRNTRRPRAAASR